jgi:GNAT superfamily N-acetyltransferase
VFVSLVFPLREMGSSADVELPDLSRVFTDPKHQCRGAGSTLVESIMEEAKKLGVIVYLEASEAAHSLYLKLGFKDVEVLTVDLSRWGATEKHSTWAMMFEP